MAKDYFQDIVPPSDEPRRPSSDIADSQEPDIEATPVPIQTKPSSESTRSIRNITPPTRQRPRFSENTQDFASMPVKKGRGPRLFMWLAAIVAILIVAALAYVAFRPTRVLVTPRTHALNFSGQQFTAYPEASEQIGSLSYAIEVIELEDSEVVESQGTVYAEDKATGNLTVYNNFQTTPLTLVKNTRFSTASGLIFRTPAEVVIPGKQGSTPGKVTITVVADQAGDQYNVPAGKFTLPGLRSSGDMYTQVYAESTESFAGGFVGERPGVAPGALEAAISAVRSRLEQKANASISEIDESRVAFADLAQIEYQSLPNTPEDAGGVRIHQKARISVPTFAASMFAAAVSDSAVSAEDTSSIRLEKGTEFIATAVGTSTVLGSTPLNFSLSGNATLAWEIPVSELQSALAGKDKGAFESIVATFPSIEEASAHIEPFWKSAFPSDPSAIRIIVEDESRAL